MAKPDYSRTTEKIDIYLNSSIQKVWGYLWKDGPFMLNPWEKNWGFTKILSNTLGC